LLFWDPTKTVMSLTKNTQTKRGGKKRIFGEKSRETRKHPREKKEKGEERTKASVYEEETYGGNTRGQKIA